MDNIQKSVIFVLVTVGVVTLMLDSAVYRPAVEPAPAPPPAETVVPTPQPAADNVIYEGTEESENFGDPVLSTDPVSDEEIAAIDSQSSSNAASSAESISSTSQGQNFNSNSSGSFGNGNTTFSARPSISGQTVPPPPPPIPGPPISTTPLN